MRGSHVLHTHRRWHERWRWRFRHSLQWRLVARFLLLALGTTLIFMGGMRMVFSGGFDAFVKPLLTDYVDRLATEIGSPPDLGRAQALVARLPISIRIEGPVVRWDSHPQLDRRHDWPDHDAGGKAVLVRRTADGHTVQFGLGQNLWRERHHHGMLWPLAGLLLITLMAYATVRRLFRPLDDIRAGTVRYGEGQFDVPIPIRRRDELGDVAEQVNTMAASLHGMLKGQRALLLAISHELRSPLTRARLNAELVPESREREALLRDLALMGEQITDLLEGERLAAGPSALKREPADLNTVVRDAIATHCNGQPARLDLAAELPVLKLDRARVAMLARNLVDNACRHGQGSAGEPVVVTTRLDGNAVLLGVRDHGPGVPEDHLPRLAQPFYRPDDARARSAGGVGLGLYLCRLVAQSHGATLTLRNASPGLEAEVRWPLNSA